MVQVLFVRVDIGVVIYEAMILQCGRSMVRILVVRVDIGVVIYEAMTPQCRRSVVQVLVVRVDIEVVIYEAMTPKCRRSVVQVLVSGSEWIYYMKLKVNHFMNNSVGVNSVGQCIDISTDHRPHYRGHHSPFDLLSFLIKKVKRSVDNSQSETQQQ